MAVQIQRSPGEDEGRPLASAYLRDKDGNTLELSRSNGMICVEIEEGRGTTWHSFPTATIWLTLEEAAAIRDVLNELLGQGANDGEVSG